MHTDVGHKFLTFCGNKNIHCLYCERILKVPTYSIVSFPAKVISFTSISL